MSAGDESFPNGALYLFTTRYLPVIVFRLDGRSCQFITDNTPQSVIVFVTEGRIRFGTGDLLSQTSLSLLPLDFTDTTYLVLINTNLRGCLTFQLRFQLNPAATTPRSNLAQCHKHPFLGIMILAGFSSIFKIYRWKFASIIESLV